MLTRSSRFIKNLSLISLFLYLNVPISYGVIGIDEIILDADTKLIMPNKVNPACSNPTRSEDVDCSPTTLLELVHKGKVFSKNKLIEPWAGGFFIHFVKLSKNSYAKDLNNDGQKEVAIYPAVCGNSHKSLAYIYSVKEHELLPYGTGVYYWEAELPVTEIKKDPKFKPDI